MRIAIKIIVCMSRYYIRKQNIVKLFRSESNSNAKVYNLNILEFCLKRSSTFDVLVVDRQRKLKKHLKVYKSSN